MWHDRVWANTTVVITMRYTNVSNPCVLYTCNTNNVSCIWKEKFKKCWWTQEWWELKPRVWGGGSRQWRVCEAWTQNRSRLPGVRQQQWGGARGQRKHFSCGRGRGCLTTSPLCGLSFPNWVQTTVSLFSFSLLPFERSQAISLPLFPTVFFLLIKGKTWILVYTFPSQAYRRPNLALNLGLPFPFLEEEGTGLHKPWNSGTVSRMPKIIIAYFHFNTHKKWGDPVTEVFWTISATLPSTTQHLPPIKDGWDGVKKNHLTLGFLMCKLRIIHLPLEFAVRLKWENFYETESLDTWHAVGAKSMLVKFSLIYYLSSTFLYVTSLWVAVNKRYANIMTLIK